jgi:hypothetical protein
MAYVPSEVGRLRPSRSGLRELSVPVILDRGDEARVATVAFGRSPQVGDQFHLEGAIWEITRVKDFQRGYVARPVRAGFCVH